MWETSFALAGRSVAVPSGRSIWVRHSFLYFLKSSSEFDIDMHWLIFSGTNIQTNEEVAIKLVSLSCIKH